jgi:hypothetical protein
LAMLLVACDCLLLVAGDRQLMIMMMRNNKPTREVCFMFNVLCLNSNDTICLTTVLQDYLLGTE